MLNKIQCSRLGIIKILSGAVLIFDYKFDKNSCCETCCCETLIHVSFCQSFDRCRNFCSDLWSSRKSCGNFVKISSFRTRKLQINNISPASILKFLARSKTIGFWQSSHSEMSRGVLFLTWSLKWDQKIKTETKELRNCYIYIFIYGTAEVKVCSDARCQVLYSRHRFDEFQKSRSNKISYLPSYTNSGKSLK